MKLKFLIALFFGGLCLEGFAKTFNITEQKLLEMVKKSNPTLDEIQATFLSSSAQANEASDKLGYELYGGYNHQATNERALILFIPVFSSVNQYRLGVKKYTKYGVVLDLNRSIDSRSATERYTDLTTTADELGIQMDLWKDFMGKLTKAKLDNAKEMEKKDKIQAEISKNVLKNNVRRLFWNLVANKEKLRITQRLYDTAQRQLKDAKKRRSNSVADKAEVARFESLVHSRKGSILSLEYEREILFKNLRELFPTLNTKELVVGDVNFNKTIFDVFACTAQIDQQNEVPFDHTKYDEVVKILKGIQKRSYKIDNTYDDIDVKLDLRLRRVGVSSETDDNVNYTGSYAGSIRDMNENDRSAMSAGLMVNIPFGEDREETKKIKEKVSEKKFDANINKIESNVIATHHQVKKSVALLTNVIKTQKENSKQLAIRVKEMKKKYSQARIPEYALIQDEESLLSSDLNIVDTQLLVVTTILDYVSVFNTFPCSFNR